MKRRLLAMGLALLLVLAMVPTVWATSPGDDTVTDGKTPEITESETPDTAGKPKGGNEGESQIQREEGLPTYIINGTEMQYESLKAAVAAAETGDTIQLTEDEIIIKKDTSTPKYGEQIRVSEKTITLDLHGHTIKNDIKEEYDYRGHAAIRVENNGDLTIIDTSAGKSGAIKGINEPAHAGAVITVINAKLTLKGGTITDNTNTGENGGNGGGIFVSNGTLTVKDSAVITGNTAAEGGGIYATGNSTVNIEGGTISNNTTTSEEMLGAGENSPAGGGGIAIVGGLDTNNDGYKITLRMSGGTITGNTSAGAGGGIGIRRGDSGCTPTFEMTGGSVTNNTAETAEGGGIRIEGKGTIKPEDGNITITGNRTESERDLGGGGIFVVNSGMTTIQNAVITDNTAGGLGGGVAACIHGEIAGMTTDGAAIYDNEAQGKNFTVNDNADVENQADIKPALFEREIFTAADAMDFFSAGQSTGADGAVTVVSDWMPGGGSHRWTGVDGGKSIQVPIDGGYSTKDYLVLTAHPTEEDLNGLDSLTYKVDISDNYARNHGGGVATNGVLLFGSSQEDFKYVDAGFDVTKKLVQVNTVTKQETDLKKDLAGYVFELYTADGTKLINTATSDKTGTAYIGIPATQLASAGEHKFILKERNDSKPGVTYDDAKYTVTVVIGEVKTETIQIGNANNAGIMQGNGNHTITKHEYTVKSITIKDAEGNVVKDDNVDNVTFTNTVNYTPAAASVQISGKKEVSTGAPDTQFTFQLREGETVLDTQTVTGAGTFTFDTLTYKNEGTHTYTVTEVRGDETGWTYDGTVYTVTVDVEANANGDLTAFVTYSSGGTSCEKIVFTNSYTPPDTPPDNPPDDEDEPSTVNVRVKKEWILDDGGTRPESITVALLRNGKVHERVTLSEDNNWTYSWTGLDSSYRWTVEEIDAPDGFTSTMEKSGWTYTIVNDDTPDTPPDEPPDNPPDNPPDEPDEPDEPEEPDTPDEPDEPTTDIPDDPTPEGDVPGEPDVPTTDIPGEPDVPTTDIPDDPTPEGDVPDEPGLPQTGQQWWPVGLLALTGAGLVLAGLFKTKYRGKHEA